MAVWLEKLGLFARSPDARPLAEIAADIDAELAFHVEESARDLCAEGLDAESARAEALKRFGDYGRIRRECARTQMGERVMLQRIQIGLTAVLIAAVGLLLWSNHEARASMVAERQETAELLARIDAQFSTPRPERGPVLSSIYDHMQAASDVPVIDRKATEPVRAVDDVGDYVGADGRAHTLEIAAESWAGAFAAQRTSWRYGLKLAERMSVLPGDQGAEMLAQIWNRLSVEHREQAMKPFVFGGGQPSALEVLALCIADRQEPSVRERAAFYLETYAWQPLLVGDGTAERWLIEWRDRPVAEVLAANATRWAREFGQLSAEYESIPHEEGGRLLAVVGHVQAQTFARAGVDLGAILREHHLCEVSQQRLGALDSASQAQAERLRSWCGTK